MQNCFIYFLCHGEFESFVNSERCKTNRKHLLRRLCLRALLIQKDAKRYAIIKSFSFRLRALLIQKDAKRRTSAKALQGRLRALLIQKDAKLIWKAKTENCSLRALLIRKDIKPEES